LVATLPLVDVSAPSSLTTGNEQLVGVSYDYIKTICEAISGGLDSEIAKGTEYVLEQNGKIVAEIVSLQKTFGRFIPTEEHHHVTPTLTWYATAPRDGKGSFDSRGFSVAFSADPFSLRRVASRNIEIAEYSGRITFPIDVHPNDVLKSMYIAKQQIVEYSRQQIQREEGK
jgi:antitoxin (DNA-binding transcriptional repressor) of toxin-antitoxin stability system